MLLGSFAWTWSVQVQSKIMSVFPSLHATTPRQSTSATEDSNPEDSAKKLRLSTLSDANDGINTTFIEQMQSFLRNYKHLETECRNLRFELCARDEQIAALRLQLLRERNKRENALLV
uniref:Uncharacterized protein n=1 Tax=Ascaris lumbricoides TaxID=6252 RepID=A0A0M3HG87_ASCLU